MTKKQNNIFRIEFEEQKMAKYSKSITFTVTQPIYYIQINI